MEMIAPLPPKPITPFVSNEDPSVWSSISTPIAPASSAFLDCSEDNVTIINLQFKLLEMQFKFFEIQYCWQLNFPSDSLFHIRYQEKLIK